MSSLPKNIIYERVFFLGYHLIIFVVTLFGLNYLSLSQPDVASAFNRMWAMDNSKKSAEVLRLNTPSIKHLEGDVRIFEDEFSGSERSAVIDDQLKTGFTLETKENSTALFSLGYDRDVVLRILPNTVLKLDLLKTSKASGKETLETTLISLVKGQIIAKSSIPPTATVDIRTKLARFSLQSSTSAISTDGTSYYLLVVKDGAVRAENSRTLKFSSIPTRHSFFVSGDGQERLSDLPDVLKFFSWDLTKAKPAELTYDSILAATGGPFEVVQEKKMESDSIESVSQAELELQIKEETIKFNEDSSKLRAEIVSEQIALEELQKQHAKEAMKVQADITCLETSKKCDLYTEKLLLSRGFGRLHNSSRMAASITKDLNLYMGELASLRAAKEKEVSDLIELEKKRKAAWNWVQSRQADKTQLKEILSKLSDPVLSR